MNKRLTLSLLGVALWGLSAPSMASIEQECAANTNHAVYVCEYIYAVRQDLAQNRPPEPFVETELVPLDSPNFDYSAPSKPDSGDKPGGGYGWGNL